MWLGTCSCSVSFYSSYVSQRTYLHGMLLIQHMKGVEDHLTVVTIPVTTLLAYQPWSLYDITSLNNYIYTEKFLIIKSDKYFFMMLLFYITL